MKLYVRGFEIDIKARTSKESKMNDADAMYILNMLSLYATEAGDRFASLHLNGIADEAKLVGKEIYNTLEEKGFYKGC